jgi:SAM-dependent methyltransferase
MRKHTLSAEDSARKANEIVAHALQDRRVYDDMAQREHEVWSSFLPKREQAEEHQLDQKAAAELRINRDQTTLKAWARKENRIFGHGLSIGCGEGRAERKLIKDGVCASFVGIDVAKDALARAREMAKASNFDIFYEIADVNFAKLPSATFDLVIAQTSLHHVLHLENVADQVARALTPDGVFWIHDYIGESQFQYLDLRMQTANRLIEALPPQFRYDRVRKRQLPLVSRREPGHLISPFESIRSAEIPRIFLERFDAIMRHEWRTILQLVVPQGTRANYTDYNDGRAFFELIFAIDRTLGETGVLPPVAGQYVLTAKK